MTTIVVNNPTDTPMAGQTNLRQAIAEANANGGSNAIVFDKTVFSGPQTITLAAGALEITNSTGPLTITGPGASNLTIDGNNLSRVFQVDVFATVSISGLTVKGGNAGSDAGGGLLNFGTLTVMSSTLSNNSATNGGGIDNVGTATLTLINSTLSNNSATNGGGIDNSGTATLTNDTLAGNNATNGGGIDNSGTATLDNTIVASNLTNDIAGTVSGSFNLIGIGGASGLSNGVNGNQVGSDANPINPELGPLADNGGPTLTIAPLPGSLAIDNGSNAFVTPGETDQRGFPRIGDGTVDIGAVEVQDIAELPMLTAPLSLMVPAGKSVSLKSLISVASFDSNDVVTVTISGVPQGFESITADDGNAPLVHHGANYTFTAADVNAGLTLNSTYKGKGQPVNTFTVTATNTTARETATSAAKTITVTDPPSSVSSGLSNSSTSLADLMSQFSAGDSHGSATGTPVSSSSVTSGSVTSTIASLIEGHMASPIAALSGGAAGLLSNPLTSSDQKAFLTHTSHA
jgi:hypothetical protein